MKCIEYDELHLPIPLSFPSSPPFRRLLSVLTRTGYSQHHHPFGLDGEFVCRLALLHGLSLSPPSLHAISISLLPSSLFPSPSPPFSLSYTFLVPYPSVLSLLPALPHSLPTLSPSDAPRLPYPFAHTDYEARYVGEPCAVFHQYHPHAYNFSNPPFPWQATCAAYEQGRPDLDVPQVRRVHASCSCACLGAFGGNGGLQAGMQRWMCTCMRVGTDYLQETRRRDTRDTCILAHSHKHTQGGIEESCYTRVGTFSFFL
jgi:hypothetical protein